MNAPVISFPAPETPTRARREAGTFAIVDNPFLTFQKRNGSATSRTLAALAERTNYTHKPPMSVAELQVETGLGQRAVEKALAALAPLGFCARVGKLWRYTTPNDGANGDANEKANSRSHERSQNRAENLVLDGEKLPLKEVEGSRRITTNTTNPASDLDESGVGEVGGEDQDQEEQAPGAVAGEARQDTLPNLTGEPSPTRGQGDNATRTNKVPPAARLAAALAALDAAGLSAVWGDWVRLTTLPAASQEAQAPVWQGWMEAGHVASLREHALDIVQSGSFSHPWGALRARMGKLVREGQDREAGAAKAARERQGDSPLRPGERRRAPDGQVWTVETVEYGLVIFEEPAAPLDVPAGTVAGWALEGGEA